MQTNTLVFSSILAGAILVLNISGASAQTDSVHQLMHQVVSPANHGGGSPALPGQDAFGAIQEIIAILEADPSTDWPRVDISTLRLHLVDMNRLVMDTDVSEKSIDGGLEMTVTGQGRTLKAIQAMVPAHAPTIDGLNGWTVKAEVTANGAKLTVTTADPKEATHIRGLGFYGLMVSGSHHQAHHLGLARGENVHAR